jgi:hypothetical protein
MPPLVLTSTAQGGSPGGTRGRSTRSGARWNSSASCVVPRWTKASRALPGVEEGVEKPVETSLV